MRMIMSDGIWLHMRIDGKEDAPPLLLLNSLGTDLRMWDGIAGSLAEQFRVIRFDKPGHGLSGTAPRGLTMGRLARHAFDVLDACNVKRADVLGLSIGGQIAMAMADAEPGRVRRLALSNTAARIGTPRMWQDRIAALEAGGIAPMADAVLERWFSATWRAANPGPLAGFRAMLARCDLAGYLACCDALAGADLEATCRHLHHPTRVIAGSADGATPADLVRATADLIPGARFACIDGAGHLPCIEDRSAFLAQLEAWQHQPTA